MASGSPADKGVAGGGSHVEAQPGPRPLPHSRDRPRGLLAWGPLFDLQPEEALVSLCHVRRVPCVYQVKERVRQQDRSHSLP